MESEKGSSGPKDEAAKAALALERVEQRKSERMKARAEGRREAKRSERQAERHAMAAPEAKKSEKPEKTKS